MQKLCDIISVLLEVLESTPGVLEVGGQEEEKGALSVSDHYPRPHLPWRGVARVPARLSHRGLSTYHREAADRCEKLGTWCLCPRAAAGAYEDPAPLATPTATCLGGGRAEHYTGHMPGICLNRHHHHHSTAMARLRSTLNGCVLEDVP